MRSFYFIIVLLFLLGSVSSTWGSSTTDIYWIDVNGGAATFIVTPAGESILIDSGENTPIQAARIRAVMDRAGVKQVDHLIISHWHADHYGGTYELSKLAPIRNHWGNGAVTPQNVSDDPAFGILMPLYKRVNPGPVRELRPGARVPLQQKAGVPPISIQTLASSRETMKPGAGAEKNKLCSAPTTAPQLDDGENARSLVLLVTYGSFRFLDAGDLTWHIEERLACPTNLAGKVDLYQVTHHGLDRSNNPHLVHAIQPRVAVVNNGATKGAEPKSMTTLLSAPGIGAVWQLYRNLKTGDDLNAPPKRVANPPNAKGGEYLKASIRSDGSFSVRIGETGYQENYPPAVK